VFSKLFHTFDKKIIRQTQFFCGHLPFAYALALIRIKFFLNIAEDLNSPAGLLFRWYGMGELLEIQNLYDIPFGTDPGQIKGLLWDHFKQVCESDGRGFS